MWQGDKTQFRPDNAFTEDLIKILRHLDKHQQLKKYSPRFNGKINQINGALAEVRVSCFLEHIGFKIVTWEPGGIGNHKGEFIVQLGNSQHIFVEVKAPTWESELTQEELLGPRKQQRKDLSGDARFFNPISLIKKAIDKAVPKFEKDKINLLAVGGYLSFVSPFEMPRDIIEPQITELLKPKQNEHLGGIFILSFVDRGNGIQYKSFYIRNPKVQAISALPKEIETKLSINNQTAFSR